MNIAVAKVLIQAFVDKHDLLTLPASPEEQYAEVYSAAIDEGEDEIVSIMDILDLNGNADVLFRGSK